MAENSTVAFVAAQQARVGAFVSILLQVSAQLAVLMDDEEEEEERRLTAMRNNKRKKARGKSHLQQRCCWTRFVLMNQDRPLFRRHMRMSYNSFVSLLDKIRPHLHVPDEKMGALRGGVIIPELQLYATIRYLAGGSYSDICFFCGISASSFYRLVGKTIRAINIGLDTVTFPSSAEECAIAAASFENISFGGVIHNCVGVLDGYLLWLETPAKKHAKNVRSYLSGGRHGDDPGSRLKKVNEFLWCHCLSLLVTCHCLHHKNRPAWYLTCY